MARHRRPVAAPTPVELVEFDPADWPGPEGFVPGSNNLVWDSPFERWKAARRVWVEQHPDSVLGGPLQLMKVERLIWQDRLGVPA